MADQVLGFPRRAAEGGLGNAALPSDLWRSTLIGGGLFLKIYTVFLLNLKWLRPSYIEAVWSLPDLLWWRSAGLPLEELLFGFGFGTYWSSAYEHITWRQRDTLRARNLTSNRTSAR